MRTLAVEVITELVDLLTRVGRCDVVSDIARRYPTPINLRGAGPAEGENAISRAAAWFADRKYFAK